MRLSTALDKEDVPRARPSCKAYDSKCCFCICRTWRYQGCFRARETRLRYFSVCLLVYFALGGTRAAFALGKPSCRIPSFLCKHSWVLRVVLGRRRAVPGVPAGLPACPPAGLLARRWAGLALLLSSLFLASGSLQRRSVWTYRHSVSLTCLKGELTPICLGRFCACFPSV